MSQRGGIRGPARSVAVVVAALGSAVLGLMVPGSGASGAAGQAGPFATTSSSMSTTTTVARSPAKVVLRSSALEPTTAGHLYVATLRNDEPSEFRGEILLEPVEPRRDTPASGVTVTTVAKTLSARYRTAVVLAARAEGTFTVRMDLSGTSYKASIFDSRRRLVYGGPVSAGQSEVGMLTATPTGRAQLGVPVSQRFRSAADFPVDVVGLDGLTTIAIVDFDSATLSGPQTAVLREFVSAGGTLVIGGGATGLRTAGPLPEDLTPLRPTGTATVPLAPFADLLGAQSAVTGEVVTGPLTPADGPGGSARVLIEGPQRVPLLIERRLGAGRVVQMAYDPLREVSIVANYSSPIPLLARDIPLQREPVEAAAGGGGPPGLSPAQRAAELLGDPVEEEDPLPGAAVGESGELGPSERGHVPATLLAAGGALAVYGLAVGPLALTWARRRRAPVKWRSTPVVVIPIVAVTAMVLVGVSSETAFRRQAVDRQVQVLMQDTSGQVRVEAWHRLGAHDGGDTEVVLPGRSVVGLETRLADPPGNVPDPVARVLGGPPVGRVDSGSATVEAVRSTRMVLDRWPAWGHRSLHTSSIPGAPPVLEAALSLSGDRLVGTVVNRSRHPVRRLVAVAPDGSRAELASSVAAGATVEIGSALVKPRTVGAYLGSGLEVTADVPAGIGAAATPAARADRDMLELAADQAQIRSGEVALVGVTEAVSVMTIDGRRPRTRGHAAVAATFALESADSLAAGLGTPLKLCGCSRANPPVEVFDFELPAGLNAALAVRSGDPPGTREAKSIIEIYNWSTFSWRPLPEGPDAHLLADGERSAQRLVRTRVRQSTIAPVLETVG